MSKQEPQPTNETNPERVYHYSSSIPKVPPKRVVSCVPSMTETLFELGFEKQVVGITNDCLFPVGRIEETYHVGAVDALAIADILSLRPDLVIVNREENTASDIAELERNGLQVWKTFPRTVADAMNLIWDTLHLFMVDDRMLYERVNLINRTLDWVSGVSEANEDLICRVFLPLLPSPLTTCHTDTYVHDLIKTAGGTNIFADKLGTQTSNDPAENMGRYPVVTLEEVAARKPDIILLPGYPLSFSESDVEWFYRELDVPATRNKQVYLVDGSLVTYHGVRLARALNEISALMCVLEEEE